LGQPSGRAPESARKVLKVAIERGLAASDPLQTQMAIWHEVNGRWAFDDSVARTTAESLVTAAAGTSLAPLEPEGIALDQAIRDGTVSVSSTDFRATDAPKARPDDPPYTGAGVLTVHNNTAADVTVYYPFGLLIASPSAGQQDVIGYATELKAPTATPTSAAAAAPAQLPRTGRAEAPWSDPAWLWLLAAGSLALGLLLRRRTAQRQ
jgi:hypothetical protein